MSKLYRVQEFADLAGVTVRALHHYDRLGLLRPRRSGSGYRLYGDRDLERLEQIVALKFLGVPLKQIQILLDRDGRGLPDVLRAQRCALEEKRQRLGLAIEVIADAERALQGDRPDTAAVLKKIIEVIEMQDNTEFMNRYYSQEAQAKLAERRATWNPELQAQATKDWTDLFRDVEASLEEDPASEKAQALAQRWRKLVEGFTGGDPDISSGLKKAWSDQPNWPAAIRQHAAPFTNPNVWEFMHRAMNCGKK